MDEYVRPDVLLSSVAYEFDALEPVESMVMEPVESMVMEPVESMIMGVSADLSFALPEPMAIVSTSPVPSDVTDNEFVESLFDAFAQDPDIELLNVESFKDQSEAASDISKTEGICKYQQPDPELMRRLGDALMLLPHEIQETIVDRLIAAIMNTDIVGDKRAVAAMEEEAHKLEAAVPVTEEEAMQAKERRRENTLPLAAATLAALLHHYSHEVAAKSHQKHNRIPVIPVHG